MKFLVIDDSQEIIDTLSLCLNLCWPQAKLLSAREGKRGLELVAEHAPDLVILDIGLPDINGLEVLRSLRGVSDVPVMILTVRDEDVEIARFLEEGADDYVVKPFSYLGLMERIQVLVTGSVMINSTNQESLRGLEIAGRNKVAVADGSHAFAGVIRRCFNPECASRANAAPSHQYHAHYFRRSDDDEKQEVVEVSF